MKKKNTQNNITSNEFINVADIKNNLIYTKDNQIISFIKLATVNITTMSKKDIKILLNDLVGELAGFNGNIRFFKISKFVDISDLINKYKQVYKSYDNEQQKKLLRGSTMFLHRYATSGEEVETNYYVVISDKYNNVVDLDKKSEDLCRRFRTVKIGAERCTTEEIIRLCNLFVNPRYGKENIDINDDIPIIKDFWEEN